MILIISGFWWKIPLFLLISTVIFVAELQKWLFLKKASIREMNWYFTLEMKHNIMKNLTINFETFFTGICIEKTHSHHYYVSDSDLEWVTPSLVVA